MTLPVPKLDDKTWAEIVASAQQRIPRTTNDWTDWNAHDPGTTFIELFAWLAEMQRFRLDQVSRATFERFFELVNLPKRDVSPASGWVQLETPASVSPALGRDGWLLVPAGTPVRLPLVSEADPFAFQVVRDTFVTTHRLRRIVTDTGTRRIDQLDANAAEDVTFFAFGSTAPDGAILEVELETLAAVPQIEIWIDLFEDDLEEVGVHRDEPSLLEPSVTLRWEYFDSSEWFELATEDDTWSFHRSGAIRLERPSTARIGQPFAMRCRVVDGVFEIPPRLRALRLNVISVTQVETEINEEFAKRGDGRPDQELELGHNFVLESYPEGREIQVGDVIDWGDFERVLGASDPTSEIATLQRCLPAELKEGNDERARCLPVQREARDRACCEIIANLNRAQDGRRVRDGLPSHFSSGGPVIEVLEEREAQAAEWIPWARVDDLRGSTYQDRHYTLDFNTGATRFGNGLNGRVLPAGARVRARAYRHTRGLRGNLAAGQRWTVEVAGAALQGINPAAVTGGRDREELEDSKARAEQAFHDRQRGVTGSDLENLARSTPGVRVARAEALSNRHPDFPPSTSVPGNSTVVVVPQRRPDDLRTHEPGPGFLRSVRRHLNQHRLVTTTMHVIAPEFVEFTIAAEVYLKRRSSPDQVSKRIRGSLEGLFHPIRGGPESVGWPFGRSVHPSEIYERLDRDPGVEYSVKVQLTRSGAAAPLDVDAKLDLPLQGLPSFSWSGSNIAFFRFGEGGSQ